MRRVPLGVLNVSLRFNRPPQRKASVAQIDAKLIAEYVISCRDECAARPWRMLRSTHTVRRLCRVSPVMPLS
jgi:hypothetical protein